jgi:hypothetical protein
MSSTARGFLGAGDVYFNAADATTGLQTGWVYAGNASKFAIKVSSDIKDATSKGRSDYGQVIASVALPKPSELTIDFAEVNRDNIHLAFMGARSLLNAGAGTVTAEAITLHVGVGAALAHGNLPPAGMALKNGATAYTAGTDYTVNYRLGIITPVAGSSLATDIAAAGASGLACTIDYGYAATSGLEVAGARVAQLTCAVRLDGKNFADGMPAQVEIYEAKLTPSGDFDFLASDWNSISMTGRMLTPPGKNEPFVVRLLDAA